LSKLNFIKLLSIGGETLPINFRPNQRLKIALSEREGKVAEKYLVASTFDGAHAKRGTYESTNATERGESTDSLAHSQQRKKQGRSSRHFLGDFMLIPAKLSGKLPQKHTKSKLASKDA
jgi:hypothetical protein